MVYDLHVDSVICANDLTAAMLMNTLDNLGVRIPDDIVSSESMMSATPACCGFRSPRFTNPAAGHLVLSTLHSGSASMAIDRIVDIFPEHQQGRSANKSRARCAPC